MFCGEWAILEPGNRCIAFAVNKGICVSVEEGIPKQESIFIENAVKITNKYLGEKNFCTIPLKISVDSQIKTGSNETIFKVFRPVFPVDECFADSYFTPRFVFRKSGGW